MKNIKIVYETYDTNSQKVASYYTTAIIPFSEKTTEYNNGLTYNQNMEAMVYDILENGFVLVRDDFWKRDLAIPIFNIKQYISNEEAETKSNNQIKAQQPQNNHGQHKQKWKPNNHKKMQRNETQNKSLPIPIKPEEVINTDSKTKEISEIC